ncbi:MAG: aldo/keto reductase [Acidobacteriota bacterium]
MSLALRDFGNTGIKVSLLGFGAGLIGDHRVSEAEVDKILNSVLDYGITLIDTARGYGASEERIGRYIAHRRGEFVLSTKVGYGIPGYHDWTYDCIIAGIDEALRILRTNYIDIVHLHSCPWETLTRGEVIDALAATVKAGKVRVAAYSGENEALAYAVDSGRFRGIMASVNICDQRILNDLTSKAREKGLGIIAKRPVANAPWKYAHRPVGNYCEEYWLRLEKMGLDFGADWPDIALRFSAYTEGVSSCIVGTTNLEHIRENIAILSKGPLPANTVSDICTAFKQYDDNWIGQI